MGIFNQRKSLVSEKWALHKRCLFEQIDLIGDLFTKAELKDQA